MTKKILVMGHAYIVEANREVWSKLGEMPDTQVDLIIPKRWRSNLVGEVIFKKSLIDAVGINELYPIETYNTGNGSFYFFNLLKLWSVLKNKKYDLIIINQEGWSLSLLTFNLVNLFTLNRASKIFLMIAQNIKKKGLQWAIPLEKFNLRFVSLIVGCCSETEDVLRWKKIKSPWKLLPLFYNSALESEDIPNIDSDHIRLGYIGRLSEEKGIRTLLESFNNLKDKFPLALTIAGDGPLRNEVEDSAADFLGLIPHAKVKDFYKKIDILIVPSVSTHFWKEQFGRVIAEGVAHGIPVVGSDSGAIPEVLNELELRYIFREGDVISLSENIKNVVEDINNEKIEAIMKNAKQLCREKFSETAFLTRILRYDNE